MLATVNPWLAFWVLVAGFVIGLVWTVVTIPLAARIGRAMAAREQAEDQAAIDHGEPTRREVEDAYGPLVMYGPSGEAYDGAVNLPRRGRSA